MDEQPSTLERLARWRMPVRSAALAGPFVTCAVIYLVRDTVTSAAAVLVLVLWVVAAAATGDRVAGLVAAVSGGVWFDFFLTAPHLTFAISDSEDIEAAVLLVLISAAVTEIALWGHRQQARAARRSGYLHGVVEVARTVTDAESSPQAVIDVVGREIADVLGADDVRYVAGPVHDRRVAVLDHTGTLTRERGPVDVDRVGLPTDEYVAVLVRHGAEVRGHFLLTATSHRAYPTLEQRRVAVVLADQVSRVPQAT